MNNTSPQQPPPIPQQYSNNLKGNIIYVHNMVDEDIYQGDNYDGYFF